MAKRNPLIRPTPKANHNFGSPKSKGILDDYSVRKTTATKQGTIEHTPTNPKDIVNKEYVDDQITLSGGGVSAHSGLTELDYANAGHTEFVGNDANLTDETLVQGDGGAGKVKTTTVTAANVTTNNGKISYTDAAAVGLNTTHRTSNGSDHSYVFAPSAAKAYLSANQTGIVTTTWTKLELDTEVFDINGEFDSATNNRFVADVAGYYQVNGVAQIDDINDGDFVQVAIYKNGTDVANVLIRGSAAGQIILCPVSDVVYLAATEYVELWVRHNEGNNQVATGGDQFTNYMSVARVA